jgi:rhodanese-related sulfurtransferase
MKTRSLLLCIVIVAAGLFAGCGPQAAHAATAVKEISGEIVDGYRVIPIHDTGSSIHLKVYRGDYIKFKLDPSLRTPVFSVPELSIDKRLPQDFDNTPFFKMKKEGTFAFTLGRIEGDITVVEYRQSNYRAITAREAADFIESDAPLILDVRTPGEYERGHLKDAVLMPVQVLHQHLDKLSGYKDKEILVYCATGNRSTVASRILIENGFKRISNMRHGIADWSAEKYPIVK